MPLKEFYNQSKKVKLEGGNQLQFLRVRGSEKISNKMSSFLDTVHGKAIVAVTATYALAKAIQAVSDKYNLSYDSSIKNTKQSLDGLQSTKNEIENLKSKAESYKQTLMSMGETYNIEFTGSETMVDMITKLRQVKDISLTDSAELTKITQENAALERQLELKEKLVTTEQKKAADNARDALEKGTKSVAQEVAVDVEGGNGSLTKKASIGNTNITDAIIDNVEAIETYKKEIEDYEKIQLDPKVKADSKEWKDAQEEIDNRNEAIKRLTEDIKTKESDLSTLLSSLSVNGEGVKALSGYEKEFKAVKEAFDALNGMGLNLPEKQLKQLNDFFDGSLGSSAIKDEIKDLLDSGKYNTATEALESLGLSLKTIGKDVNKTSFNSYFDELIKSAGEAENAINSIDGSINGVKKAFESENKDYNWNSMADYLSKANELYNKGKVGTDDFKAAVQFMSPNVINPDAEGFKYDADAYVEVWKNAQAKVARYFDANNPFQSVTNFTEDLKTNGLAIDNGEDLTWNFKSSAEAANALGLSVQATEAIMHSLESYGAEFDEVMFSGEGLDRYKTNLDKIKDVYESIQDEGTKNRLKGLIEGWDENYEKYQNDLSGLTEDQIVKIKFEYDLATLQKDAEEALETAAGTNSNKDWVTAGRKAKESRQKLEEQTGYNDNTGDMGYSGTLDVKEKIESSRANKSGDELKEANKQIAALETMLTEFQLFRLDGGELDWASFLGSENANEAFKSLQDQFGITKEQFAELLNTDYNELFKNEPIKLDADVTEAQRKINGVISEDHRTITMDVDASVSDINYALENLQQGQTLTFQAEVDGKIQNIEAIKNEQGQIEYTATVGNEEKVLHKEGNVFYTGEVSEVDTSAVVGGVIPFTAQATGTVDTSTLGTPTVNVTPKLLPTPLNLANDALQANVMIGSVQQMPTLSGSADISIGTYPTTLPSSLTGKVNVSLGSYPTSIPSITQTVFQKKVELFNGTAHVNGTVRNGNAFASGNWSAKKSEKALVGELGQETIVRNGKFFTVGDHGAEFANIRKGDIVFNHRQTEELFKNGYVTSGGGRAKVVGGAFAKGTAYANGWRPQLPGSSSGGKKKPSYSSKTGKSSKSSNSAQNAANNAAKAAEDVIDWIATLLDRVARQTEIAVDAIDTAIGLANKQAATAKAISQVQNEINTNQQAYNRYLAQANSVGLSENYASQVRNGSLNIESISDESLKKKVTDYENWLISSQFKIYLIAGNSLETYKLQRKDEINLIVNV